MSRRMLGAIVVVVGAAVLLVSAGADLVGLGESDDAFGYRQAIGVAVGAALVVLGLALALRRGGEQPAHDRAAAKPE